MEFINNWSSIIELDEGTTTAELPLPDGLYRLSITDSMSAPTRREIVSAQVRDGAAELTRGIEGTATGAWPEGSIIYAPLTAGILRELFAEIASLRRRVTLLESPASILMESVLVEWTLGWVGPAAPYDPPQGTSTPASPSCLPGEPTSDRWILTAITRNWVWDTEDDYEMVIQTIYPGLPHQEFPFTQIRIDGETYSLGDAGLSSENEDHDTSMGPLKIRIPSAADAFLEGAHAVEFLSPPPASLILEITLEGWSYGNRQQIRGITILAESGSTVLPLDSLREAFGAETSYPYYHSDYGGAPSVSFANQRPGITLTLGVPPADWTAVQLDLEQLGVTGHVDLYESTTARHLGRSNLPSNNGVHQHTLDRPPAS